MIPICVCRPQAQRAVAVAMLLSDLSTSGVPVDLHSVVAAVVVDGVTSGHIPIEVVHREHGMGVRSRHRPCPARASAVVLTAAQRSWPRRPVCLQHTSKQATSRCVHGVRMVCARCAPVNAGVVQCAGVCARARGAARAYRPAEYRRVRRRLRGSPA